MQRTSPVQAQDSIIGMALDLVTVHQAPSLSAKDDISGHYNICIHPLELNEIALGLRRLLSPHSISIDCLGSRYTSTTKTLVTEEPHTISQQGQNTLLVALHVSQDGEICRRLRQRDRRAT